MTDNKITRETTFSEELPYFKERIKEVFDNYHNPNGYEDPLYIAVLRDSKRVVRKAEEEINRQQVENKRLEKEVNLVSIQFQDLQERYEESQAEIERLKECPKCVYEYDGETTEYCVQGPCSNFKTVEQIKSEAVKEFAERLEEKSFQSFGNYGITRDVVEVCDIDNLVKEMVGEDNA